MADLKLHANNYASTLNGAITNVQTTITVTSATGLPSITGSQYYALTIDDGTNIEIVHVTDDTSSPTLTVTRGQEGTSGTAFADLTKVQLRVTADDVDRKQEDLDGAAVTQKVTPVAADKVLLQDSADSDNLKYSLFSAFGGGASNFVDLGDVTFTTTTSTNDTATFDAVRFMTTDIPAAGVGGLTLTREAVASTTNILGWRYNGGDTVPAIVGGATTSRFSFDSIGYPEINYSSASVTVRSTGLYTTAGITGGVAATYDFNNATALKIPQSASPTVTSNGHLAIDTSVTDWSHGILQYYGTEKMGVVAMPDAEFTSPTDGHVVTYNATSDEFELAGSNWELISSASASSDSSIDFTGLSTTYFTYKILFHDVTPVTDGVNMYFRVSTDGGSTWKSGASDYSYVAVVSGTVSMAPNVVVGDSEVDTMHSGIQMSNGTNEGYAGEITIINPADTSTMTQFHWYMAGENSTNNYVNSQGGGRYETTGAVDGFRILLSSGNISVGEFKLYGMRA